MKQIPDPARPGELDPQTHRLRREGKPILDEADSYGVEMALQLVATAGEPGQVSLVSMGPAGGADDLAGIRTALAMGADRAVVVSDARLPGADALATATVLAAAVTRLEPFDLVLAATESTDGYTGTVPEMLAARLDLPSVTFAKAVAVADGAVVVQRQTEAGTDDVRCPLPALVSVTAGVVEPRYPSFKGVLAARSKPVDVVDLDGLGLEVPAVGQQVVAVAPTTARAGGTVVDDDGQGHLRIVELLESLKVV